MPEIIEIPEKIQIIIHIVIKKEIENTNNLIKQYANYLVNKYIFTDR